MRLITPGQRGRKKGGKKKIWRVSGLGRGRGGGGGWVAG